MWLRLHSYGGVSRIAKAHERRLPAQEMMNMACFEESRQRTLYVDDSS
jgi:hypothetical protein